MLPGQRGAPQGFQGGSVDHTANEGIVDSHALLEGHTQPGYAPKRVSLRGADQWVLLLSI